MKHTAESQNMQNIRISIIVPVYNTEQWIEQCIRSLQQQTLKELEIIVSDDCSSDKTTEILRKMQAEDGRIVLIEHEKNSTASKCRKDAVLQSRGEYVMFVDGDDYLETNACEVVWSAAKQYGCDVLQFGSTVENCAHLPQSRIEANQKALRPCLKPLSGKLTEECFVERRFGVTLWNKLFRGDIARKAMTEIEDGRFPKANDVYAVYFLLKGSKSYRGIEEKLYHYCFGRGMTGHNELNLEAFRVCCQSARVWQAISRHVQNSGKPEDRAEDEALLKALRERFLKEQVGKLLDHVKKTDRQEAVMEIKKAWGMTQAELISTLAAYAWERQEEVLNLFPEEYYQNSSGKPVKTIALYYHAINTGGAQRVVAQLSNLLAEKKEESGEPAYKVVLITDEVPSATDYPIHENVIREFIPDQEIYSAERYGQRYSVWAELVTRYRIDALLCSEWDRPVLAWDMISLKSMEAAPYLVVHIHTFCGYLFNTATKDPKELQAVIRHADAVVVLSEADRIFWSRVNNRVVMIPNPCVFAASRNKRAKFGRDIIWVGRLSKGKKPKEALRIMQEVVSEDPTIRCHIVGEDVAGLLPKLEEMVSSMGLTENVFLEGFRTDMDELYQNSSILLHTSKYEGFPLTLYEAASFGLPVIMYDLPYLAFYNMMEGGFVPVAQGDTSEAAREILGMMHDEALWQNRSDIIYQHARAYEATDITVYWLQLFKDMEAGREKEREETNEYILLDQITQHHCDLVNRLRASNEKMSQRIEQLENKNMAQKKALNTRTYRIVKKLSEPLKGMKRIWQRTK